MLDPKLIRTQPEAVAEARKKRGYILDVATLKTLEEKRKPLQINNENLQQERNSRAKSIGQAKSRGEDIQPLFAQVEELKQQRADASPAQGGNSRGKSSGQAKCRGEGLQPPLGQVDELKQQLAGASAELEQVRTALVGLLSGVPTRPAESVPEGTSERDRVELRRWGSPR